MRRTHSDEESDEIILTRCRESQERHGREDAPVAIWFANPRRPYGGYRLFPGGPMGAILERHPNGASVEFKANEIIASIEKLNRRNEKVAQ